MQTYMTDPKVREMATRVLKTAQVICKATNRLQLIGFHISKMEAGNTILYATDGWRLLKWETNSPILISEGTEGDPGHTIEEGTYHIASLLSKDSLVVLENVKGNYPDCEAVILNATTSEIVSTHNRIAFNVKQLYELVKNFDSMIEMTWVNSYSPCIIKEYTNPNDKLTLLCMPLSPKKN